jgi:hypothetical protein
MWDRRFRLSTCVLHQKLGIVSDGSIRRPVCQTAIATT